MSTRKKNLDVYLQEVFKQFIAIKDDDFKRSQEIFKRVFDQIKQKMEEKCNYFSKYASQVTYGGSVSDGIKVGKLDEFDMDIVIRLPINYGDSEHGIIIENESPGFVKLKITNAFDHLDKQKEWESCNKVTRDWRDTDKYFLQNKFRHWLHSIIQKALNDLNGVVVVNERTYLLKYKASGPAYTLLIRNNIGDPDFILDIDFVPVIRFMLPRWPPGYKIPEGHKCKEWFVVPKPNKSEQNESVQNRCWRLSFQDFEREMIKDCKNLKMTIRLVKKLRDALGMSAIASYYIKTLFLWKIHHTNDKKYWETKISVLFRAMVQELYNAIKDKNIPYFWNEGNNLIDGLKPSLQALYADKLNSVLKCMDADEVERTVLFLLTIEEINEFKNSQFYKQMELKLDTKKQNSLASTKDSNQTGENSGVDTTDSSPARESSYSDSTDSIKICENNENSDLMKLVRRLMEKVEILSDKVEEQNERIFKLEMKQKSDDSKLNISVGTLEDRNGLMFDTQSINSNLSSLTL